MDQHTVKFKRLGLVFRVFRFLCWTNISHANCTLVPIQNWNHKQACSLVHVYLIKMPIWFDFIHINKKFASTAPPALIQEYTTYTAYFLTWGPYWHTSIFRFSHLGPILAFSDFYIKVYSGSLHTNMTKCACETLDTLAATNSNKAICITKVRLISKVMKVGTMRIDVLSDTVLSNPVSGGGVGL